MVEGQTSHRTYRASRAVLTVVLTDLPRSSGDRERKCLYRAVWVTVPTQPRCRTEQKEAEAATESRLEPEKAQEARMSEEGEEVPPKGKEWSMT